MVWSPCSVVTHPRITWSSLIVPPFKGSQWVEAVDSTLTFLTITIIHPLVLVMPKTPRSPASSSQNLTQAQKQQLIAYHKAQKLSNPSYLQKDLSAWAKDTFSLSYTPSKATIYRILHSTSTDTSPSSSKKRLPSKLEDLETLLADWVQTQHSRGVMINHHLIKQQGQIFQTRLNSSLPEDQKLALKFSNGWLQRFNNRHSFSQQTAHGESGSVDQQALDQQLPSPSATSPTVQARGHLQCRWNRPFLQHAPSQDNCFQASSRSEEEQDQNHHPLCLQLNWHRKTGPLLHWQCTPT